MHLTMRISLVQYNRNGFNTKHVVSTVLQNISDIFYSILYKWNDIFIVFLSIYDKFIKTEKIHLLFPKIGYHFYYIRYFKIGRS